MRHGNRGALHVAMKTPGAMAAIVPRRARGWAVGTLVLTLVQGGASAQADPPCPPAPYARVETKTEAYTVPVCSGADPEAAATELARGRALFFEATAQDPPDEARLNESLSAFEAQCAAGDSMALERIASVLVALGRHLAAARTFDCFRIEHPLSTLQGEDLKRVQANEGLYYEHVGSLLVRSTAENSEMRVGKGPFSPIDDSLLRLAPGVYSLEVRAPGHAARRYSVRLAAGETQLLEATLVSGAPGTADPSGVASPVARKALPASNDDGISSHAVLLLGAAAAGGLGIAGLVWSYDRINAYADANCPRDPSWPACRTAATHFDIARGLQIGGLTAASILLTAGGVLWLLHLAEAPAAGAAAICGPALGANLALHCAGRF